LKYLTLIDTIALLHQYQRPIKERVHSGRQIFYIEVTVEDIAVANRLAHAVLGRTLDELPPQTRKLVGLLHQMVSEASEKIKMDCSEYRFSRREIRKYTGWTYDQVRVHVDRLIALEYLLVHRGGRGQSFVYELLYDGKGEDGQPFLMGLIDVEVLKNNNLLMDLPQRPESLGGKNGSLGGVDLQFGVPLGTHWGVIGVPLGGVQRGENANNEKVFIDLDDESAKKTHRGSGETMRGGAKIGAKGVTAAGGVTPPAEAAYAQAR
jgi:hypothetical protein